MRFPTNIMMEPKKESDELDELDEGSSGSTTKPLETPPRSISEDSSLSALSELESEPTPRRSARKRTSASASASAAPQPKKRRRISTSEEDDGDKDAGVVTTSIEAQEMSEDLLPFPSPFSSPAKSSTTTPKRKGSNNKSKAVVAPKGRKSAKASSSSSKPSHSSSSSSTKSTPFNWTQPAIDILIAESRAQQAAKGANDWVAVSEAIGKAMKPTTQQCKDKAKSLRARGVL
ncbi:hypothetical protein HK097_011498 [Rhizophlyctis rosea]|uniref:Uncharacterized protein n=1 Tax=Rhizophlyctis rosea TaxID=64517 RepID=A0AAD5S668_9FUNG|nr:hypothetical protein HK097_011498 [Rhizophlyctis rosea]